MSQETPVSAILTGTTASGKTALALRLARDTGRGRIEIVNADSLLVYRGLDIGTAKPPPEERAEARHHLVDIRDPDQGFTAGDFVREARQALEDIHARGKRALIVGGTGFYLKALLYGLWRAPAADPELRARLEAMESQALHARLLRRDAESALRIGPSDRYRLIRAIELLELAGRTPTELQREQPADPDPMLRVWVIDRETRELQERIASRTRMMLNAGLIDEVQSLRAKYPRSRALSAVGYRQVIRYLDGIAPEGRKPAPGIAGLESEINLATRQLVKQQRTWFRGQKSAKWFVLDRDLSRLETEFRAIYGA